MAISDIINILILVVDVAILLVLIRDDQDMLKILRELKWRGSRGYFDGL